MRISDDGLKFIEHVEGKRNKAYLDSGGELTIGIGHLITRSERMSGKLIIMEANPYKTELVKFGNGLTDDQIYRLLKSDVLSFESIINVAVKVPLEQYQFDSLVSFVFNIGGTAFVRSTLLKLLNFGSYELVSIQMRRWVYDNGKIIKGLQNRREKEILLWNGEWNNGSDKKR